ncbi:MAG: dockerin type I repeat-containing protein [Phycisphaerales bacterium]|nr:dockerin type I repeat-containing protein [Phycisphaerales bacterium]
MVTPTLLTLVLGAGLTELSGGGSMYVFARMGPWSNPICGDGQTTSFDHHDLLDGLDDHIICIDGAASCQAFAETRIELRPDGFTAKVNGWGDAFGADVHSVFSRHDIIASMDVAAEEDLRISVSWFLQAAGLGSVQIEMHRLGDLDGGGSPSQPIISRGANAYIDPISFDGYDVLAVPQGRWRIKMVSTHQAMDTKSGFEMGFARTTHTATYVSTGDVNGDGSVDVQDLLILLDQYGDCPDCLADLDGNGQVDVTDLLQLLEDWED